MRDQHKRQMGRNHLILLFAIFSLYFAIAFGLRVSVSICGAEEINKPDPLHKPVTKPNRGTLGIESDGIIAKVNGAIITRSELERVLAQIKLDRKDALKSLIEKRLLFLSALKDNIKVTDEEIDYVLKKQIAQVGSKELFEKMILSPLKISYPEYREKTRRQLMREKFILKKASVSKSDKSTRTDFLIDTFVTPKELKEYYETHQNEFTSENKIKTRQIIIRFKDNFERITKRTIGEDILKALKKGSDFAELARKYSEIKADSGGLWDWIPKGSFPEEVEKIIYQLKEGEISPLIETENKFWIIKVEGKIRIENTFENPGLQEKIRYILVDKKLEEGAERLIQELAKKAEICPAGILGK